VFGVFREQAEAVRAQEAFAGTPEYQVALGPSLQNRGLAQISEAGAPFPDAVDKTSAKKLRC
jgi:hypothetical protein